MIKYLNIGIYSTFLFSVSCATQNNQQIVPYFCKGDKNVTSVLKYIVVVYTNIPWVSLTLLSKKDGSIVQRDSL